MASPRPEAHPRSRGENDPKKTNTADFEGSSPLTRGKHATEGPRTENQGLIPAHAGKTEVPTCTSGKMRAHPRSRGENGSLDESAHVLTGSSPLTRGKPTVTARAPARTRLIPAHAGKTTAASSGWPRSRAHPRSRGENYFCRPMSHENEGSSPLTRGKRRRISRNSRVLGLIPAHAGKTTRG